MKPFDQLPTPWQAALEEAWTGYCQGSLPIGSVIVDEQGEILARGRNRLGESRSVNGVISGNDLAHAEINALLALPSANRPAVYGYTLYTTMEPCPQCLGALVMSGVRGLNYASRDPWAGCTDLLDLHPYIRSKKLRVSHPSREVQDVCGALALAAYSRLGLNGARDLLLEAHEKEMPHVLQAALHLHQTGMLPFLKSMDAPVTEVYEEIQAALRVTSPPSLADA